ncbi:MAG: rhomboid family intramembrane serine protease [Chloroflexi bacterium]|jgi:membrane associated rhomboid family serine protease|nr:rhomboid family intramembrane serine protease [Chloroflexota bacterium]
MRTEVKNEIRLIASDLIAQGIIIGSIVGVMWLLELIDILFLNQRLNLFGIRPRDTGYMWGIAFAPFLHGGISHLLANTPPFIALGWLVLALSRKEFLWVTIVVTISSGLGAWLFGASNSVHIGASGVIFGYFGFLLARGFFDRQLVSIALSLIVGAIYGYLLWGVLPNQPNVSWQGHLFGFLGGVLLARGIAQKRSNISKPI